MGGGGWKMNAEVKCEREKRRRSSNEGRVLEGGQWLGSMIAEVNDDDCYFGKWMDDPSQRRTTFLKASIKKVGHGSTGPFFTL